MTAARRADLSSYSRPSFVDELLALSFKSLALCQSILVAINVAIKKTAETPKNTKNRIIFVLLSSACITVLKYIASIANTTSGMQVVVKNTSAVLRFLR